MAMKSFATRIGLPAFIFVLVSVFSLLVVRYGDDDRWMHYSSFSDYLLTDAYLTITYPTEWIWIALAFSAMGINYVFFNYFFKYLDLPTPKGYLLVFISVLFYPVSVIPVTAITFTLVFSFWT